MKKLLLILLLSLPLFSQPITIDCGSPTDQFFVGGSTFTITTPGATGDLTVRYGSFKYRIPRAPGLYHVKLRLRETGTVTGAGQRLFSVKLNDQATDLDRFDLFAAAGLVEAQRNFVAISYGSINLDFTYQLKSAVVSSIEIDYFIIAPSGSDPKKIRVTNAVPVWMNDGYYFPRPVIQSSTSAPLLYEDVAVYKNGARLSYENLNGFAEDYTIPSRTGQLKVLPIGGQRWPVADQIIGDYTAVFPPDFIPETVKLFIHPSGLRRADIGSVSITGAPSSPESLADSRWAPAP